MKRILICLLACLAALLPLSFLAAADTAASTGVNLGAGQEPKQFVPGPVTEKREYASVRWTAPKGEKCTFCGSSSLLLENYESSWGAFEFIRCTENPLLNDSHQDRIVIQQVYCENCDFLQRKQFVRETRVVCTSERYQLVPR